MPSSKGSSQPRSPALQENSLPLSYQGSPVSDKVKIQIQSLGPKSLLLTPSTVSWICLSLHSVWNTITPLLVGPSLLDLS